MSMGRPKPDTGDLFTYTQSIKLPKRKDEFYERLNKVLDLSFVRDLAAPLYAEEIGRPSVDPVIFIKCMLIGFFENIVYSTELEERIADSLVFRKYLGYKLDQATPDESTFRKTLQRFPEEVLQAIFERVLGLCKSHRLIMGRIIGHDSTKIDANASIQSLVHRESGISYCEYLEELKKNSSDEEGEAKKEKPSSEKFNDIWVSTTDPDARVAKHSDGHAHLSYKANVTVDLETEIILSARMGYAEIHDQHDFLPHVDQARSALNRLGYDPFGVTTDKGYHSGENLAAVAERNLVSFVSCPKQNYHWSKGFAPTDFRHDPILDELICPCNQRLPLRRVTEKYRLYRAPGRVCKACPYYGKGEGKCTNNRQGRTVRYTIYDQLVVENRQRVRSHLGHEIVWGRMQSCEAPFGWLKRFGGLGQIAGRGLANANKRLILAACCWNLGKVVLSRASLLISVSLRLTRACLSVHGTQTGINNHWQLQAA